MNKDCQINMAEPAFKEDNMMRYLEEYVKCCVEAFETKILDYEDLKNVPANKKFGTTQKVLEKITKISGFYKAAELFIGEAANVCETYRNSIRKVKAKKVLLSVNQGSDDALKLRKLFITASKVIFQCFEAQFYLMNRSDNIKVLADDTVDRVTNYISKHSNNSVLSCDLIHRGVVLGKSKNNLLSILKIVKPGKAIGSSNQWKSSEFFECPGIVRDEDQQEETVQLESNVLVTTENGSSKAVKTYFILKGKTDDSYKFGYRHLFPFEESTWASERRKYTFGPPSDYKYSSWHFNVEYKLLHCQRLLNYRKISKSFKGNQHCNFDVIEPCKPFVGRKEQLREIHDDIQSYDNIVIAGPPGVGKSELARQYVKIHGKEYDYNVWINANTETAIVQSFNRLAEQIFEFKVEDLSNEKVLQKIYSKIRNNKILVVFQNVRDNIELQEYLPPGANACVLITSVWTKWTSTRKSAHIIPLDCFVKEEAREFIRHFIDSDASSNKESDDSIDKLAQIQTNMSPIYLRLTISEFLENQLNEQKRDKLYTISKYIRDFNKNRNILTTDLPPEARPISHQFENIFENIKNAEHGNEAMELLEMLSVCAIGFFPECTFESVFNEKLRHVTALLEKFSMITITHADLSIHCLVQDAVKLQMTEGRIEEILDKLLGLLKGSMLKRVTTNTYLPHIVTAWNVAYKFDKLIKKYICDVVHEQNYTSYIHLIVEHCSCAILVSILNRSSDAIFATKTNEDNLLLHMAARGAGVDVLAKLISLNKENINAANSKYRFTPLHYAVKYNSLEVAKELIRNGADVNVFTNRDYAPLHLAVSRGTVSTVMELIKNNAKVNVVTKQNCSPLYLAVKLENLEIVNVLRENKANPNLATIFKMTPLHEVCKSGNEVIFDALIDAGATISVFDKGLFSPLHQAAQYGCTEIVEKLLKQNGKSEWVNARTEDGNTALHLAVIKGHVITVGALMAAENVDTKLRNKKQQMAWEIAQEKGDKDILKMLKPPNDDGKAKIS